MLFYSLSFYIFSVSPHFCKILYIAVVFELMCAIKVYIQREVLWRQNCLNIDVGDISSLTCRGLLWFLFQPLQAVALPLLL